MPDKQYFCHRCHNGDDFWEDDTVRQINIVDKFGEYITTKSEESIDCSGVLCRHCNAPADEIDAQEESDA